jgi:hypothetical protein
MRAMSRAALLGLLGGLACDPPIKSGCDRWIFTGIVGWTWHESDTDRKGEPGVGDRILVFSADDPGLAQPIPPDLAERAKLQGLDPERPGERDSINRVAVPPELLGPPVATSIANANGCFDAELVAGDYVLTEPGSMRYVSFTAENGKSASCTKRSRNGYVRWSCVRRED